MTALLLLAHGSPRPSANADFLATADAVRATGRYDVVLVGFLECNVPSIPEAIDACVAAGANRIVAVPYFLHTGTHVVQDLPDLLRDGARRHPEVAFRLGAYVGASPLLTELMAERSEAAP